MIANIPTGTVTFLFTDIESSTQLWETYPEAMKAALAQHDALLRNACETHNGYVFKTVGDAFCAAFATAPDALNAGLAAQRQLQAPLASLAIKVRMALHTGATEERDMDYFGPPLNRVARLLSAGHGGQILLSLASQELVRDQLPAGVSLLDCGERRLKDLVRPEHIFQVLAADLPVDFPPLKTLDTLPNNLPVQLTSFVGREKEIAEVKNALANHRLVTLTGPGGTGKTRLSLQVAADVLEAFPKGVWFVELAPLADPALVAQKAAFALGLRELQGRPAQDVLSDYLREKTLLLILDNCEHLVEACAALADALLRACPGLKILASSREALGIAGEAPFGVGSLTNPDPRRLPPIETLTQYEAVRLFIERATTVLPTFAVTNENAPALAQICHKLDGIPLAIELAAARVKVLRVEQIATRLDDAFRLLTGGSRTALPRQQTLRALIDWSYALLSEDERALLQQLAVFAGGWTLEAAESVCAEAGRAGLFPEDILDLLTRLVDKSLVLADHNSGQETRYGLLETVRQYAQEKLAETDNGDLVRERHLDCYLRLAVELEEQSQTAMQTQSFRKTRAEFNNFRSALAWALGGTATGKNPTKGLRLANAIDWDEKNEEGLSWLQAGLAQIAQDDPTTALIRAKALAGAGRALVNNGRSQTARSLLAESLALYRAINPSDKGDWVYALTQMAYAYLNLDLSAASTYANEAVALGRDLGAAKNSEYAAALYWDACVLYRQTNYEIAMARIQQGLRIFRETGHVNGIAIMLTLMGFIEIAQEDYDLARAHMEEARRIALDLGMTGWAMDIQASIADVDRQAKRYTDAQNSLEECVAYSREVGDSGGLVIYLVLLGETELDLGEYEKAAMHLRESLQLLQKKEDPRFIGYSIAALAGVLRNQGHWKLAARLLGAVEAETDRHYWYKTRKNNYLQCVEDTKAALGEPAFASAFAEGQAMTLMQATAYALNGDATE